MRRFMRIAAGLSLFVPLLLAGCGTKTSAQQERKPPKVTVALPVQQDVTDSAEFSGTIRPMEFVEIRARVQGYLKEVYFKEGEMVRKGTPLFLIEQEPFKANLAAAEALKKQTEAALKLAQANYDRYRKLYDKKDGTVTLEEVQTYEAQRDAAAAKILADDAAIDKAEIDLGYTAMRAPITGLMSESKVDVGNLVGGLGDATLLATIVQMNPMYVYFDVSEDVVLRYLERRRKTAGKERTIAKVFVGLKNEEGYPHEGELDFIDNQIDSDTGASMVRGTMENKSGHLYSGQFVRVIVPLDPVKDAILVDEEALGTDLDGKYVLVVDQDNVVEQRLVDIGPLLDGMRVIREPQFDKEGKIIKGLKPDERYIIKGIQRARPGLSVDPEMAGEAANEATEEGKDKEEEDK